MTKHNEICKARTIKCPLVGCSDQIMFMDIKKHQATRCKIAKKRRKLIEEKAERLLLEENNNKKEIPILKEDP